MAADGGLAVRALATAAEMREVVALQWEVWGPEDSTPANQLIISAKTGGHVLGAFADDRLVAFAYAFPAVLPGRTPWLASHMLATRPAFGGRGIGRMLKWRQRDWALEHGFERITWTFDPLEARM
jgi:predicted GNAT superfamily acetyltransferase